MGENSSTRRNRSALLSGAILVLGGGLIVLGLVPWPRGTDLAAASPAPSIIVGIPGGAVIPDPTREPTPSPAPAPTAADAEATPEPIVVPSSEPTPVATADQIPQPVADTPPPPSTPGPAPVVVAVAGPADSVIAFYDHVVAGRFDQAYALWSVRMQATYPREANLDDRFDETASITFQQLGVVEQGSASATVQANFTETADSGSSMEFIGYWSLVQVDGRWLLDEPHY